MSPEQIDYIVVHCSATIDGHDIGYAEIDAMHRDRGWAGCGYHIIIRLDGTIELGRPYNMAGAHAYGYNRKSWGICLVGGLDSSGRPHNTFTDTQMTSLLNVVRGMALRAPDAQILGHRDLSPDVDGDGVIEPHEWVKQCPCFDVKAWINGI